MNFRTQYSPEPSKYPLDIEKGVVLIGSCFTSAIGKRMQDSLWRAFPNPTGVLYNPASISKILRLAICDNQSRSEKIIDSISSNGNLCTSWLSDSSVSSFSAETTISKLENHISSLSRLLREAGTLIVTFGTSWVYSLADNQNYVVANCHKYPAACFRRWRLTIEDVVSDWTNLIADIRNINPNLRIIFTVSPIRHLKDGFEGNSCSKAVLLLACEELCKDKSVEYFPSYEILNDDLRDYRFYASDMAHPSSQAEDYIWECFCRRFLTDESIKILAEGNSIVRALNHRPIISDDSKEGRRRAFDYRMKMKERYQQWLSMHPKMSDQLLKIE